MTVEPILYPGESALTCSRIKRPTGFSYLVDGKLAIRMTPARYERVSVDVLRLRNAN